MKFLVFCIIVVANISNNGKASLDSFAPTSNILFEDTTRKADTSCNRPCKFNVKPRRCYYSFKIEPNILADDKPGLTINGMTPGPPIHVCLNDVIVVDVHNKVPGEDLTIHWHGIEQKGTPYMDGVPMITQCPISYGFTYKYAFIASSPGTFFYHSDSVSQQSDGVYGSLIINQPQPLEPHSSLYDYDRGEENTLLFAARFPELLTGSLEDISQWTPADILVNGDKDSAKIFVLPSFAYRLRLINAIGVECPLRLYIENHDMVVIATDGRPVKPVSAKKVLLYPGERMDVVVKASQSNGGYWIKAVGTGACSGLETKAMLLYSGYNYTEMLQGSKIDDNVEMQSDVVYGQMLESLQDVNLGSNAKKVYLGVDTRNVNFDNSESDFRYVIDKMPKNPIYPASLSLQKTGTVQINKKNFLYPNVPILLKPRDVQPKIQCVVGEENKVAELQCMQVLNTNEGDLLELALVNEGHGSNDSYTFHMHGYSMQVIATWQKIDGTPLSRKDFERLEAEGKIERNLKNPVVKDTITVPNKGFTLVRILIDKGGSWLLECRACSLYSLPAAILLNTPQSIPKSVVDSLPNCGTFKPPDVLLN